MMKRIQIMFPIVGYGILLLYLCAFRVGNTDFWWHVKAGQIFRKSGWIHTDPFAYTRMGEAYIATHEWLAQIILSQIYDIGGYGSISILRAVLVLLIFCIPLLLHRKAMWINGAFAVVAAVSARPALTDRPQLFTFLFFSLVASLCISYLDANKRKKRSILVLLPVIIVLWSNLHGAASITGIALFAALFLQRLWSKPSEWKYLTLCLLAMSIAPIISPNGIGNVTYLLDLSKDKAADLIAEWQPSTWRVYLRQTGFFWIVAVASLLSARKHMVFFVFSLAGIGYLSRTAARHEVLFIIVALASTVYQLRFAKGWNRILDHAASFSKMYKVLGILGILGILGLFTYVRSYDINRKDNLFGYGVFEPMRGASQYIKKNDITGNMFNNYNAGGELLFLGHKVFLDGRNIDYGYAYISDAVNAGVDSTVWNRLDQKNHFTHAVIYYDLQAEMKNPIPYTDLLDADPNWQLVYLDDWSAVYTELPITNYAVPAGRQELRITTLTPKMLHQQIIPEQMSGEAFQTMQAELMRMISDRPDAVKARLYLAKLYTALQMYDQAQQLLQDALNLQPHNFRVHLGFSKLKMEQGDWDNAYKWIKSAKRAAGFSGLDIDEGVVERIKNEAMLKS